MVVIARIPRIERTRIGFLLLAGLVGCGPGPPAVVTEGHATLGLPSPTPLTWEPGVRDDRDACASYCDLHGRATVEGTIDLDCGNTFVDWVGPRQGQEGEDVHQRWIEQRPRAFPNANAYGDYDYDEFFQARVLYCPACREADFLFGSRYDS